VYANYTAKTSGAYACVPGAHIAAVVASEFKTPFYVVKSDIAEGGDSSNFFGTSIAVEGTHILDVQLDSVPEALVTEIVE
jgi:methylthioribose-1-phosphate isomerase